jgi:quercetin dioxygenase-like cupin family protein
MSVEPVIAATARRTETPAGVMTTLASPTQGGSHRLSLWRVEMQTDGAGPTHVFDSEQLWTVIAGRIRVVVDGRTNDVAAGDAIAIPAGVQRQITSLDDSTIVVCGYGDAVASVPGEETPRGTPAWIE